MSRPRIPDSPDRHGTTAGYRTHRRAKENACVECRTAWAAYIRGRRRQQRLLPRTPGAPTFEE